MLSKQLLRPQLMRIAHFLRLLAGERNDPSASITGNGTRASTPWHIFKRYCNPKAKRLVEASLDLGTVSVKPASDLRHSYAVSIKKHHLRSLDAVSGFLTRTSKPLKCLTVLACKLKAIAL